MSSVPSTPVRPQRRPFGLHAIIVLQMLTVVVSGAFLLILSTVVVLQSGLVEVPGTVEVNGELGLDDFVTLIFTFSVNLVCAFGLWRRKRWAWYLTMLQLGVFMISDLYSYFTDSPAETYAWSMLLNVMMVFYLNQRDVRALFMDARRDDLPARRQDRVEGGAAR